jgi:hypothetical protein
MELKASAATRNKDIGCGKRLPKARRRPLVLALAMGWLSVSLRAPCATGPQTDANGTQAEPKESSKLRIIVRVYLYAFVSPHIIARAEDYAGYVLGKAGVEGAWSDCGPSRASHKNVTCEGDTGSPTFTLRFVSELVSVIPGTTEDTLGYSVGYIATVNYPKAQNLAARGDADIDVILGCAIAHEIGHLLLGQNSHSAFGIMKSRWSLDDLQLARKRGLRFTPEQAERIHGQVLALMRE